MCLKFRVPQKFAEAEVVSTRLMHVQASQNSNTDGGEAHKTYSSPFPHQRSYNSNNRGESSFLWGAATSRLGFLCSIKTFWKYLEVFLFIFYDELKFHQVEDEG